MAEYSELADSLPRVTEPVTLLDARTGFAYVTEPNPAFVMPELRGTAEGPHTPSIILVEARVARWGTRCWRGTWRGGPERRYGTCPRSLSAAGRSGVALAKAFGSRQLNSVIGRLLTGEFVLIIDALDEAEMHAVGEAFDAFLDELRYMFAATSTSPGVVILGRSETIEYVDLFLGSQVPRRRYRILDFDEERASKFVDSRLDFGPIAEPAFALGAHRKRESVYVEARKRLFDFLDYRILPTAEDVDGGESHGRPDGWSQRSRSFLGYAPVLETIAEYRPATPPATGL